jgi:hypothetical protein
LQIKKEAFASFFICGNEIRLTQVPQQAPWPQAGLLSEPLLAVLAVVVELAGQEPPLAHDLLAEEAL